MRSWRIAGLYGVVALPWIYFSDQALVALVPDPMMLVHVGIYKGIFFVLVTTVMLFLMMQRTFGETEESYLALVASDDERRQAMTKLARSEQRYRSTLDNSLQGCQIIGFDWEYLYLNGVVVQQAHKPREEMLGKKMMDVWPGFEQTAIYDIVRRCLEERKPFQGEAEFVFPDGRVGFFDVHAQPVPEGVFALSIDVTERKKLEQQFLRAQRMESIGTLSGGIAHDLNNVLSPILMSIELLRMQEKDLRRQNILSTIESSTKRGAEMVRQVLSFARGVEGRQVEVEVQPRHVLREIEKIVDETFLKTIRVTCDVPADLWTVIGDPTQLHQVLLNLCVNARDAMPEGGVLSLSAENMMVDESFAAMHSGAQPGHHVLFRVSDTGTGMPPEVVDRIFEPFFTTKEIGKGTGLGLSTSLAIIKSHGGFVRLESEQGQGTVFRVYLPAKTAEASGPCASTETDLEHGKGELVLVVDDEAAVRQITRQTLEAFGYRVILAADGAEASALFAARNDEISVVITDMMMPVMDGPATIQVLKRMRPDIKIIGASGLNLAALTIRAAEAGAHCFIPKPFTAQSLLLVLRRTLDGKPVS